MDDSKKRNLIFSLFLWILALVFIIPGLFILVLKGHILGLALICFALPFTNTTWGIVKRITNRQLSSNNRIVFAIVSFLIMLFSVGQFSRVETAQIEQDKPVIEKKSENQTQITEQPQVEPSTVPSPSPTNMPEEGNKNEPEKPTINEQSNLQNQVIKYQELGTNQKSDGEVWHNIAISYESTDEEVLKLAQKLHADFPNQRFRFFGNNNASMISKYKAWDEHYPDEENYPYPEEWADKYYLGIINEMMNFEKSKMEWQLVLNKSGKNISL